MHTQMLYTQNTDKLITIIVKRCNAETVKKKIPTAEERYL